MEEGPVAEVQFGHAALSCARTTGDESDERAGLSAHDREEKRMGVMVGTEAPDFEASGFQNGGWVKAKLSDYRGKWVVLCFYPGDFTYV
jgi:peroxiredoxin (alkyl hydroperoxide reductase subunit C)